MLYALICTDKPNSTELRTSKRPDHLAYLGSLGDAMKFADPAAPEKGLVFDGRVAEDFKLNSGTWVNVGTLRVAGIAALAPLAQDIVVTGHGGDEVRFLVFPNIAACRAHAGLADSAASQRQSRR